MYWHVIEQTRDPQLSIDGSLSTTVHTYIQTQSQGVSFFHLNQILESKFWDLTTLFIAVNKRLKQKPKQKQNTHANK